MIECNSVRKWRILNIRVRVYSWGNTYITFTFSKWGIFQSIATVDVDDKNVGNTTKIIIGRILVLLTPQHATQTGTSNSATQNSKPMKLSWSKIIGDAVWSVSKLKFSLQCYLEVSTFLNKNDVNCSFSTVTMQFDI